MHIRSTRGAAIAVLTAMALIPATLSAASAAETSTPASAPGVTVGEQATDPSTARDYWTPSRVKEAVANEKQDEIDIAHEAAVAAKATTGAAKTAHAGEGPRLTAEAPRFLPAGRDATGSPAVLAAVPEMAHAEKVPFPQSIPAVIVGKILYVDAAGESHGCSGASIIADGKNTVWTAGHCVHPGDGSGADGFHDSVLFIPGYKESATSPNGYDAPWGEWVAQTFVAPEAWTQDKDYNEGDLAAFTVKAPAGYTNLADTVGALGYRFGDGSDWSDIIDSGFPGEGYNRTDMDGYTQFFCTGNVVDAANLNPFDDRLEMDCDMGGGASGGPMATTEGQIVGANSHVEVDDSGERINDNLYSSNHGSQAVAVINRINELN
ncbi:trypsin-like serine peptidase [Streptomyces niveus]|uniref:trypsin-like serine peptidase n=1 Tax=Streptomyces TaxID=1883 RepID=UPI000AC965B5|nr:trypsin-like peptidase domain-containing protein [Streptomyces sp. 4R-3d]TFI23227.1 hypothetical protein E4P36_27205 [Streptomyces sp. 4R-3d]